MIQMRENPIGWTVLFLVCLAPVVILAIWPKQSVAFILSDAPLNGWLGSLYGGYLVVGFLVTVKIPARAFREWEASVDWERLERTRFYRGLKFVDENFLKVLLALFIIAVVVLFVS